MESIIKKAIEGGYSYTLDWNNRNYFIFPLLDPLFWQALGKACVWVEYNDWWECDRCFGAFGTPIWIEIECKNT